MATAEGTSRDQKKNYPGPQATAAEHGGDVELASASLPPAPPTDVTEVKGDAPLYRKRGKLCLAICCGSCVGLIVLVGIIILILAFTVFKAKEPVITVDNVQLGSINLPSNLNMSNLNFTLSLQVAVSVYNPNHASFRYGSSMSYVYYRTITVGEAPIPAGKIGARGTEMLHTTLKVNSSSSVLTEPNLMADVASGVFPLSTYAQVSGRVNVLNIFKHHGRATSFCNLAISILTQSVLNMTCSSHVKF